MRGSLIIMTFYWEYKLRIMSPYENGLAEASAVLGKFQNTGPLSLSTPENVSLGAKFCKGTSQDKQSVISLFINPGIYVVCRRLLIWIQTSRCLVWWHWVSPWESGVDPKSMKEWHTFLQLYINTISDLQSSEIISLIIKSISLFGHFIPPKRSGFSQTYLNV